MSSKTPARDPRVPASEFAHRLVALDPTITDRRFTDPAEGDDEAGFESTDRDHRFDAG